MVVFCLKHPLLTHTIVKPFPSSLGDGVVHSCWSTLPSAWLVLVGCHDGTPPVAAAVLQAPPPALLVSGWLVSTPVPSPKAPHNKRNVVCKLLTLS